MIDTLYKPLLEHVKVLPGVQSARLTTAGQLHSAWEFNMSVELRSR